MKAAVALQKLEKAGLTRYCTIESVFTYCAGIIECELKGYVAWPVGSKFYNGPSIEHIFQAILVDVVGTSPEIGEEVIIEAEEITKSKQLEISELTAATQSAASVDAYLHLYKAEWSQEICDAAFRIWESLQTKLAQHKNNIKIP